MTIQIRLHYHRIKIVCLIAEKSLAHFLLDYNSSMDDLTLIKSVVLVEELQWEFIRKAHIHGNSVTL